MGACFSATDDENAPHNRPRHGATAATAVPAANPELKGVTLETKPKRLTDEEKALRDKSLTKYKRQKAQQERREERAVRHTQIREVAAEAGEDVGELSETCSSTMTMSTSRSSTTLAPSTLVYGRGGYLEDDEDDEDDRRSLGSHVSGRTANSGKSKKGTTRGGRTQEEKVERQRRKQRHQQYRRRHGAADEGHVGGKADIFHQWASGSSAVSEDELSTGSSDDEDDDDDRRSIASSLPRAPEDVLGVENMILPPSAPYHRGGTHRVKNGETHEMDTDKSKKKPTSTPSTSPPLRPSNSKPGRSLERSPPHASMAAPAHARKKWTGKQAEHNVAMSGFFATQSPSSPVGPQPQDFPVLSKATAHTSDVAAGPPRAATQGVKKSPVARPLPHEEEEEENSSARESTSDAGEVPVTTTHAAVVHKDPISLPAPATSKKNAPKTVTS